MRQTLYILMFLFVACGLVLGQTAPDSHDFEWRSYGHDPGGMRFSPLKQINRTNVQQLQRAWTFDVPTTSNSWIEAFENTPLMVDGVLYFATQTGVAHALDAETGKQLWAFDPFGEAGAKLRPVPNRGVAYWEGKSPAPCGGGSEDGDRRIFYATPDARLFALDAATGKPCKEFGNGGAIFLPAHMAPDLRAGRRSELAGEMPDSTRGTIDQHLAPEQQTALAQRVQCGEARDRQRRRLGIVDRIRQRSDRMGAAIDPFGPGA